MIWNWSLGLKFEVEVWSWRNLKQKKFEVEEIVVKRSEIEESEIESGFDDSADH